ncbi:MAG: proton-conducting transporter membrane subunit, partial [Candidatus Methylomirabilis sp.]
APHMRVTAYAFLIGALASAGIFPLAGFWSQGQIFFAAFNGGHYFVWLLALSASFLTAFYMFRLYLLTFSGRFRGDPQHIRHLRKTPASVWAPLVILALFSVAAGFVGVTPEHGAFHNFLGQGIAPGPGQEANVPLKISMALLPLAVASAGIGLAYLSYVQWWDFPDRFRTLYMVFFRRYFVDEIYYAIFLTGLHRLCHRLWKMDGKVIDGAVNKVVHLVLAASASSSQVDERVVDGAVDKVAHLVQAASATLRRLHTGVVQHYILALALGIFVIAILYLIFQ